ncbi:hypothetical protein ACSBR1_004144 [Camellia fascicularis]
MNDCFRSANGGSKSISSCSRSVNCGSTWLKIGDELWRLSSHHNNVEEEVMLFLQIRRICVLYGLPNETWEVNLPVEEVPLEFPEPALGINFARDQMQEKDLLSLVAVHSDSWLLSVAFYFGARFGFGKSERKRLFQLINDLPTIFEVVTGNVRQPKDQSGPHSNSSKIKSSGKMQQPRQPESQPKTVKTSPSPKLEDESGGDEE